METSSKVLPLNLVRIFRLDDFVQETGMTMYDTGLNIGDEIALHFDGREYQLHELPMLRELDISEIYYHELDSLAGYVRRSLELEARLDIDGDYHGDKIMGEILALDKDYMIIGKIETSMPEDEETTITVSYKPHSFSLSENDFQLVSETINSEVKTENKKEEEETNMFSDLKNGFGKADPRQFKLSINGLAVLGSDNKYHTYNPEARELVEVSTGFFEEMKDLLFIMPAVELEVGDVILHQGKPYHITVAKENLVKGINFENATEDTLVGKTNVFGVKYYTKVFNCLGSNNVLGDLASNPMMTYAMMGGSDFDLSKIMMFQAMSKGNGISDFSENPMMLMALMGNSKDGMSDFMKMQMFSQMSAKKTTKKEN